ncbi:MAG: peptidase, partial [Burkholderiales bacterium]|nr:peptidase [Burkholderiales bacterium]
MRVISLVLSVAVAFGAVAQPLPDLGSAGDAVLSPQMERRIGESIVRDIRFREPSYLEDPE